MAQPNYREMTESPSGSIISITPQVAERWLALNESNRNIRVSRVEKYARDMVDGHWKLTGEGVKFSTTGRLIDGQHRLLAIVRSGATIPMFVFRGIDDQSQDVMDTGACRSASDALAMAGMENAALVSSIARRRIDLVKPAHVTHSQIIDYVSEFPEVKIAARIAVRYRKDLDIDPSTVGVAIMMIASVNGFDSAEDFFRAAAEKTGLAKGDPVIAMTRFFTDNKVKRVRHKLENQLSAIIRAYNARVSGRSMSGIRMIGSDGNYIGLPPVIRAVSPAHPSWNP